MKRLLLLAILDGYGYTAKKEGNAVLGGKTPNLDKLIKDNPTTLIEASGLAVGLPEGQIGNSEVGHMNLGAGRVVYQGLTRITKSIEDGDIFKNKSLVSAINYCKSNSKKLHIMGLASKGGVHSHLDHLYALLRAAKDNDLEEVYIHCFTDGRDVNMKAAKGNLEELQKKTQEIGAGKIATIIGRYYAMDRDNRWERVKVAYDALTEGKGEETTELQKTIESKYSQNETDEFLKPIICDKQGLISKGDAIIFFNFRPDRAREITKAFVAKDFDGFKRESGWLEPHFVCMTQYDESISGVSVMFEPMEIKNSLSECLSASGLKQLHIAETEKYAHVTFFFSGGKEEQFDGEDRELIASPRVATYDLKPEMSANEVTEATLKAIESDKYDVIILNFANCDMVGHTGSYEAAVKAVETVDINVGKIADKVKQREGIMIITADHGNAEEMVQPDGEPMTAHTTNPVTFTVLGYDCELREGGKLGDVAPTMLDILGLEKPEEMTGNTLIKR